MNTDQLIEHLTPLRKQGNWYTFTGIVEGKEVRIKAYKTWCQILDIDSIHHNCGMDVSVKEWKETIVKAIVG